MYISILKKRSDYIHRTYITLYMHTTNVDNIQMILPKIQNLLHTYILTFRRGTRSQNENMFENMPIRNKNFVISLFTTRWGVPKLYMQ